MGDQALAQFAQRGCGVPCLEDIQEQCGHGSEKPALDGPAWAQGWTRWSPKVRSNLSSSVIRWESKSQLHFGKSYINSNYAVMKINVFLK